MAANRGRQPAKAMVHDLHLSVDKTINLKITDNNERGVLLGQVGLTIPQNLAYTMTSEEDSLHLRWEDYAELDIVHTVDDQAHFYEISWKSYGKGAKVALEDHFQMINHWYGCGHVLKQPWPLEKWNEKSVAMVTGEPIPVKGGLYGGVQERYFLCSEGAAIYVDFDVPLHVGINHKNSHKLTFNAKYSAPYQQPEEVSGTILRYHICCGGNVKATHLSASKRFWKFPPNIPDERMFKFPIWSTWAQYKKNINQKSVLEFAEQIKSNGFKHAQIEIDDDWTPHYGDMIFDQKKFPDPKKMCEELQKMDFRVTIWVHPFISSRSAAYKTCKDKNYLIRGMFNKPGTYIWWNGTSALLDLTNPDAVEWFVQQLANLRDTYGIASFKFDAGEASRFNGSDKTHAVLHTPNTYSKEFAELAYRCDESLRAQEIRVGTGVQHLPIFFRLQDKDSNWDYSNGLKTIIPHVLTQGLLGYPFVLPDMIGGNAYALFGGSAYPDRELFIRWMQVNAFLPAMQFSVVPWMYDEVVVQTAREICQLHEKYSDYFIALAQEATETGAPIVRPVWWLAPTDEVALTIDSEFLVGDKILVAPVLDKGVNKRNVYLPPGKWKDELQDKELPGGWHNDYPAQLNQLPFFTKLDSVDL